jgi:hypothetical protein
MESSRIHQDSIFRWALFGKISNSRDLQEAIGGDCSGDLETGHE